MNEQKKTKVRLDLTGREFSTVEGHNGCFTPIMAVEAWMSSMDAVFIEGVGLHGRAVRGGFQLGSPEIMDDLCREWLEARGHGVWMRPKDLLPVPFIEIDAAGNARCPLCSDRLELLEMSVRVGTKVSFGQGDEVEHMDGGDIITSKLLGLCCSNELCCNFEISWDQFYRTI